MLITKDSWILGKRYTARLKKIHQVNYEYMLTDVSQEQQSNLNILKLVKKSYQI